MDFIRVATVLFKFNYFMFGSYYHKLVLRLGLCWKLLFLKL